MRSRYTAFVLGDLYHIENTHACDKSEGLGRPGVKNMFGAVEWDGLKIFSTSGGLEATRRGRWILQQASGEMEKFWSPGKLEFSPR